MNQATDGQQGYIALITVLIMCAAGLAIATTVLFTGADSQRSALVGQNSTQARNLASACAEEGLEQVRENSSYSGTASQTYSTGTCSYTVTSTGTSTRTIDASSTINGVVRKLKLYVTINASSISLTSWQEVS